MNTESLRRGVYALLITIAVAAIVGRILAVVRVYEPTMHRADPGQTAASILAPLAASQPAEATVLLAAGNERWQQLDPDDFPRTWPRTRPEPMPTLGANDRSRWATVRALVDDGTYVIGHRETDPQTEKYRDSGIVTEDGWQTIDMVLPPPEQRVFLSSKPPLFTTLVAGEYWVLKKGFGWSIVENRWLVVRTILLTVNVLPFIVFLVLLSRLAERYGTTDWGRLYVVAAACFATFLTTFAVTLNNHGPAAYCALFALYPALRIGSGERGVGLYLLAGFFAALTACFDLTAASFAVFLTALLLWRTPARTLTYLLPAAAIPVLAFFLTNYLASGLWRPVYSEFGGPWYDFPGSHWNPPADRVPRGVDWAGLRESRAAYAFNFLLGHHGLFSLSPIWLLALAGTITALVRWRRERSDLQAVAILALTLTVIVIGFYLTRGERTRNYGGFSSGPRWLFWLIPLWLLTLLPVADWLAHRRWGRALGLTLLGFSVISVSFPAWNPWRHPWIYQLIESHGWIRY